MMAQHTHRAQLPIRSSVREADAQEYGIVFPSWSHQDTRQGSEQQTSALALFLSSRAGNHTSRTFLVVNKSRSNTECQGKPSRDHLTHFHLAGVVVGLGNSWWLCSPFSQELLAAFRFPEESHLAKSAEAEALCAKGARLSQKL